jgi:N6-adenosine-specific RNA methylase IME4
MNAESIAAVTGDLTPSNSLADLAARIRAEHVAMQRGVEHAMRAGDLLLEAKAQLRHGQWLPWLTENCSMSERTAQLYMRVAERRSELEAKAQGLADLTLEGAARLLAKPSESVDLTADIVTLPVETKREVLEFAKRIRAERVAASRAVWEARVTQIANQNAPLPRDRRYPVILADPPWPYQAYSAASGMERAAEAHYPCMSIEDICALPVADLATPDAVLFLWTTNPHLFTARSVLEAWGFEYRTNIVWVKDVAGLGYWVRNQHELLLIAARGNMRSPPEGRRPSSRIMSPRREHSRKPDETYALIEAVYPEFAKIELFARHPRPGWHAWGNEAPSNILVAS